MELNIEKITFVDSSGMDYVAAPLEQVIEQSKLLCLTHIGYVLFEDEERIVLANHKHTEEDVFQASCTIPKSCITERRSLYEPDVPLDKYGIRRLQKQRKEILNLSKRLEEEEMDRFLSDSNYKCVKKQLESAKEELEEWKSRFYAIDMFNKLVKENSCCDKLKEIEGWAKDHKDLPLYFKVKDKRKNDKLNEGYRNAARYILKEFFKRKIMENEAKNNECLI